MGSGKSNHPIARIPVIATKVCKNRARRAKKKEKWVIVSLCVFTEHTLRIKSERFSSFCLLFYFIRFFVFSVLPMIKRRRKEKFFFLLYDFYIIHIFTGLCMKKLLLLFIVSTEPRKKWKKRRNETALH